MALVGVFGVPETTNAAAIISVPIASAKREWNAALDGKRIKLSIQSKDSRWSGAEERTGCVRDEDGRRIGPVTWIGIIVENSHLIAVRRWA